MAQFTQVGVEAVVKGHKTFMQNLGSMSKGIAGVGAKAAKMAAIGVGAAGAAVAGLGALSIKTAIDFESAFAGVLKTTDGLGDSMFDLTDTGEVMLQGFKKLTTEIPQSFEQLAAIGEIGGQLGVQSKELVGFTKAIAGMGEATNLSGEEAATGIAQIFNAFGQMPITEAGVNDFGSAVVALGNNSATTERDIVNFTQRIAGAGQVAGLSLADVSGIGAAFASVGVEAQAGGTAVSKVLTNMAIAVGEQSTQLEIFAGAAGMTADEFTQAFEEDAAGAFATFTNNLGEMGTDAVMVLEELGIADQRLISAFLRAGSAGELLGESIATSNAAFADGTALHEEASKRYDTTAGLIQIMKNRFRLFTAEIGTALLPILRDVVKGLEPMLEDFGKKLPGIIKKVGAFIRRELVPRFKLIVKWLKTNIPIAVKAMLKFWNERLLPALKAFGRFIATEVVPRVKEVIAWFREHLPRAIEAVKAAISVLASFWKDTLLPAIQQVIGFVQENLVPILSGIAVLIMTIVIPAVYAWAAANVAAAVATLAAWAPVIAVALAIVGVVALLVKAWQEDFLGVQTKTKEVWEKTLKPAFEAIKEWLEVAIPKAIETVKSWWEETLKPALETVANFITTTVIPAIESVVEWLGDKIPEAMGAVKGFWEETLEPALQDLRDFIEDPLLVWVGKVVDWLKVKVPEAMQAIADFWNGTLKGVFQSISDFIQDPVITTISELVTWIKDKIIEGWNAFKDWWEGDGTGFIQGVVDWIQDPLIVKIEELIQWIEDIMTLGFKVLVKWWQDHGERLISWIAGGFGKIKGVIDGIIGAIGSMIEKAKGIKDSLPDWLIPGSPMPLEIGLLGVNDALKKVNTSMGSLSTLMRAMPKSTTLTATTNSVAAPITALPRQAGAMAGGAGSPVSITLAPTINNGMDFAVFEARVKSIVTKSVGE